MKIENIYQCLLIILGGIVVLAIAFFAYREVFPEYKIYQHTYQALEEFRSETTGEPAFPFPKGIKQIVIPADKNPEVIDRCISCHVAIDHPNFSPIKIATNLKDQQIYDDKENPVWVSNPNYIWAFLEKTIQELKNPEKIALLRKEKNDHEADQRIAKAIRLQSLKDVEIGGKKVNMSKVLSMHPLIGNETRPFENHPLDQYGCTSCHSGNGRSLVAKRAHGAVFDGDYEPEHKPNIPQFLEKDLDNDPPFSHMYNCKPGHDLAFQTTPLLVGPLMDAKCVQCHASSNNEIKSSVKRIDTSDPVTKMVMPIDKMLLSYNHGKELFISQSCYACHKIAGFSRGNVGMELTKASFNTPWFIKEAIVWPQGIDPSSSMPNFCLDHEELADLMTFLMGQTGQTKTVSEIDYEISIKAWEQGAKLPWEKPLPPTQMQNIKMGMKIFAEEGCAACHKLKGFTSSMDFAIQTENEVEEKIQAEEWFTSLFPENIPGSEIVSQIIKHKTEIDQKIVFKPEKNNILDEIEKGHPGLLESFYSNFKFAVRAKNRENQEKIRIAQNSEDLKKFEQEISDYKECVRKVLMIYIELYGLGRDIAPHLHWSGIFRDEAWLLGHFRNPNEYTAKSIMPVMPFDDSKFFALTHMLHVLSEKNRNAMQQRWLQDGFNPSLAFNMLCASCHGEQRQGNGIISDWIYPIPKNLKNPVFLRGLTKSRAIDSIAHGVVGTPMPPWAKSITKDRKPVLSHSEISHLVDWLFQDIPEAPHHEGGCDEEKWNYSPENMIEEMQKDNDFLKPYPLSKEDVNKCVTYYFESHPNKISGSNNEFYVIRDEFYTEENIQKGKEYYMMNCATCHGVDGGGTGVRSTSMTEAKPRALTNIPWLKTRDDLRLLRSIKYGVPGTAMIPWGDQTTHAQRMSLVIFIRQLTKELCIRNQFKETLSEIFDHNIQCLSATRIVEYTKLEKAQEKHKKILDEKEGITSLDSLPDSNYLRTLYFSEIALRNEILKQERLDQKIQQMIARIHREKGFYESMGSILIGYGVPTSVHEWFMAYIKNSPLNYIADEKSFTITLFSEKEAERENYFAKINKFFNEKIEALELKKSSQNVESSLEFEAANKEILRIQSLKLKIITLQDDVKKEINEQWNDFIDFAKDTRDE